MGSVAKVSGKQPMWGQHIMLGDEYLRGVSSHGKGSAAKGRCQQYIWFSSIFVFSSSIN